MSSVPSVLSESYEDVLSAVQESARGRWFLQEYAVRLRTNENKSILDAIHKLEGAVADLPAVSSAGSDISKIREAFEKARRQIGDVNNEGKKLSEEGQVFNHLADLARNAFKAEAQQARPEVTRGIEMALRIVQNIENEIRGIKTPAAESPVPASIAPAAEKPAQPADAQKYFQQDADMFAPPAAVLNKVHSADKPAHDEGASKGAKLKVFKIDARDNGQTDLEATSAAPANSGHAPAADPPAAEHKPRITISRRKPEELQQVPLADPEQSENAA